MPSVAIVTDSASDLPPAVAAAAGVRIVPLIVNFADDSFKAGVELSFEDFWEKLLAPSAPFPTTAAASPGDFRTVYERAFEEGAEAVVTVTVSADLSGTHKSATIAAGMLPDREIHVIDSRSASMGHGLLALLGAELARDGQPAAAIAGAIDRRLDDVDLFVAVDTLEYLRKGGRITPAVAAIGSLLSLKPIITVTDGKVEVLERVRTRAKARERVLELLTASPVERFAALYSPGADVATFRDEVVARIPGGVPPEHVSEQLIGPSVGPHVGPGCVGGVILRPAGSSRPS